MPKEQWKMKVVFLAMSNVFTKERECYQNIIDFIIEPNDKYLSDEVESKIHELRKKNSRHTESILNH
jgi:hypothetical protein